MADLHELEYSFINRVAAPYLALSEEPDAAAIAAWRYRHFIPLLHRLHGRFSGLVCHQASVNDHRIAWLEGGNPKGEPLLLLHGFGACKENWLPLLPFLWRRYHLYIPDLPGWGQSEFKADACYAFDDEVARLADWAAQQLPASVHIVGSSMGGGIGALLAARHPHLAKSLTLLDAAGVAGERQARFEKNLLKGKNGLLAKNFREVLTLLDSTMTSRLLPWLVAPLAYPDLTSRYQVNQHIFRQLLSHPPADDHHSFSQVSCPTLVIWGDNDRVIHPSCADTFKQLVPHAQIRYLDGIGHMPMVEAPRLTARLLHRFLRSEQPLTNSPQPVVA